MLSGLQVFDTLERHRPERLPAKPRNLIADYRHRHDANRRLGPLLAARENFRNRPTFCRAWNHEQYTWWCEWGAHHRQGRCLVPWCHHVHLDQRRPARHELRIAGNWHGLATLDGRLARTCQLRRGMSHCGPRGAAIHSLAQATCLHATWRERCP